MTTEPGHFPNRVYTDADADQAALQPDALA
jgi:hypothetical protein